MMKQIKIVNVLFDWCFFLYYICFVVVHHSFWQNHQRQLPQQNDYSHSRSRKFSTLNGSSMRATFANLRCRRMLGCTLLSSWLAIS